MALEGRVDSKSKAISSSVKLLDYLINNGGRVCYDFALRCAVSYSRAHRSEIGAHL